MASVGSRMPVRVSYADEQHALSLARELIGLTPIDVGSADGRWDVTIEGPVDDRLVARVLDGVRRSLGADPGAVATVNLDGHEYQLYADG